jgi:formate hydrogenlyase subunit 3/multisubunit Na+/H+ antiporter MnhD subunit
MALRQEDIKRLLAYSSMSQLGYIVTAIALMSHLGWVTALYLVANHMLVKGILFLAAAVVILRTGTRSLNELGGLARKLPFTFAAATVAIVGMSGLPPLMGFGGKWLLLSAMMEKGWYGPVILGVIATLVGLLYMIRLLAKVFFGERTTTSESTSEPLALIVPQYIMIAGILIVSLFPKLLIDPVSAAIDPYFSATLVWEGMSLKMIYGFWNPVPTMTVTVAISVLVILGLWAASRRKQRATAATGHRRLIDANAFRAFYKPLAVSLTPPLARLFWGGISRGTVELADRTRRIYDGNGQTYMLYVVYYFIVLYIACGGIERAFVLN